MKKMLKLGLTFMEPCIVRCVFHITNEMQVIQCSLLLSELYSRHIKLRVPRGPYGSH